VPLLDKILGGAAGDLVDKVGQTVDRFVTTEAERATLKAELAQELHRHHEQLLEQARQAEASQLLDVQQARLEAGKVQAAATSSWLARNVGYLLDLGLFAVWATCTIYLVLRALKLVNIGSAVDLTGVLAIYSTITAAFMTSLTFHRGSSRGSEVKDAALRQLLDR